MPPSTVPPSPTVTFSTRTSPLIVPSIWTSPPPVMLPSRVMSLAISDASFWARGAIAADRAASGVAGAGSTLVGAGAPGVGGVGLFEVLLNIVAGPYEAEGILSAAVDP